MLNTIKIHDELFLFFNHVVKAERAEIEFENEDDGSTDTDPYGAIVTLSNGKELMLPETDAEVLFSQLNAAFELEQSLVNQATAAQQQHQQQQQLTLNG